MNVLEPPEYYEILEVTPSASLQEIKKAYKKLALKYHPDKHKQRLDNNTNIASNNQFILINEAYSVLAHEESRARYDSMRCMGEISEQELSEYEFRKQREIQLMREIMAKKEQINVLYESFTSFAISMGWIMSNSSSIENDDDKLFSTFEKEISLIESCILEERVDLCSSDTSPFDSELSTHYLPEDDIVQIIPDARKKETNVITLMENPQWILIDKETLVMSEFVDSYTLIIRSVTDIVYPLMMACTYGTWAEQKINLLQKVTELMTQIIQYLELIIKKDGKEFESIIIDKMKTEVFQTQLTNLQEHPILPKISDGRLGQNLHHPLINLAALFGPPFAGQSLYWSILAVVLLGIVAVRRDEGDLESFRQYLNIFEEIVSLLDSITN